MNVVREPGVVGSDNAVCATKPKTAVGENGMRAEDGSEEVSKKKKRDGRRNIG